MHRAVPMLLLLAACGESYDDWPDLRGRYNIRVESTEGCVGGDQYFGWLSGPLIVRGELPDLTYDFGGDRVLPGTSTESGRFSFRGTIQVDGEDWDVTGRGSSTGEGTDVELSGSADVMFDDDDCEYIGNFVAPRVGS